MKPGEGPTLTGPTLRKALREMHVDLDCEETRQFSEQTRHKNNGRQKPTNHNQTKKEDIIMTTQTTDTNGTNAAPKATVTPADEVAQLLKDLNKKFEPKPKWQTAATIGGAVVVATAATTLAVYAGTKLANRSPAAIAVKKPL